MLAAVETALYTQGLIPATGTWSKIAAMVAMMLGAAGFAVVRGNTKIAAIQAGLPQARAFSISAASLKAKLAAVGGGVAVMAMLVMGSLHGCATGKAIESGAVAAGSGFIDCSGVNLNQIVKSTGKTLLETVAIDLVTGQYAAAAAATIAELGSAGEGEVACAVDAVDQVVTASTPTPTPGAPTPAILSQQKANADALIAQRGWKFTRNAAGPGNAAAPVTPAGKP